MIVRNLGIHQRVWFCQSIFNFVVVVQVVLHPLEIKDAWSLGTEVRPQKLGFFPLNEFTVYYTVY